MQQSIEEAESIRQCINTLSQHEEKAVALSVGVTLDDDSCITSSDNQHDTYDDPTASSDHDEFWITLSIQHSLYLMKSY